MGDGKCSEDALVSAVDVSLKCRDRNRGEGGGRGRGARTWGDGVNSFGEELV